VGGLSRVVKDKPWPGTIGAIVAQPALMRPPQPVRTYQPGPFAANHPSNGTVYLEGPTIPKRILGMRKQS